MSTIIMAHCWKLRLPSVAKFVLVSLADQANDQGVCWPSVQTLSERTSYSIRAVQTALGWLRDQGFIDVDVGACRSNRYTLRLDRLHAADSARKAPSTPAADAPPQHMHPAGAAPHPRRSCTLTIREP